MCIHKFLAAFVILCSATLTHAACSLSPLPHPRGVIGLQLFYADDPRSWNWADDLAVSWLRIELRWDWIEPHPGQYDWTYVDTVMTLASAHPQKIMVLFNHPPRWATQDINALPTSAAATLAHLVQRHDQRVLAWEIFNEPNLPGFGWPKIGQSVQESAAVYASTLSAAAVAIRELDKKAFIISAGLSPQNDPESYARWLVKLTPPACYDAIGLHPYGQQGRFSAVQNNVVALLEQENRPQKPVWFTEYGTDNNRMRHELLQRLGEEARNAPITFFFTERDIGRFTDTYGLRRKDGSPKLDYASFKRLLSQ